MRYCPLDAAVLVAQLDAPELVVPSVAIAVWLFCMGAAIGSFLNVVVYRLPAGKSLIHPGSRCPACGKPIRPRDNVPIVGWLLLRGRCRDCGAAISRRYPTVEAAVAVLFVVVAYAQHLPLTGATPMPDAGQAASYAYLVFFYCSLLAIGLMNYDGHRAPMRVMVVLLGVGLAGAVAWPRVLGPGEWLARWPVEAAPYERAGALARSGFGLLAGGGLGMLFASRRLAVSTTVNDRRSIAASLAAVGIYLGWSTAAVLGVASTVAMLIVGRTGERAARVPWTGVLVLLALAWLVVRPRLLLAVPWLGPEADARLLAVSLAVAVAWRWLPTGRSAWRRTG